MYQTKIKTSIFLFALLLSTSGLAQSIPDSLLYSKSDWYEIRDSVKREVRNNTITDTTYAPAFYTALYHYPELYDTEIIFQKKRIKTTAATRPSFFSVFKKSDKRTYKIFINNKRKTGKAVYYYELPYNAKIGLIGHELSHIKDYSSMKSTEIIWMGAKYILSTAYRKKLEHHVDMQAIDNGLGYQIYLFSDFVFNKSNASEKYLNYKRKYYLLPEEILFYLTNGFMPGKL